MLRCEAKQKSARCRPRAVKLDRIHTFCNGHILLAVLKYPFTLFFRCNLLFLAFTGRPGTTPTTCTAYSTGLTAKSTCPAGSYCPTAGMTAPTACGVGPFCPTTGLSSVISANHVPCRELPPWRQPTACGAGFFCPESGPAGYYCPDAGMAAGVGGYDLHRWLVLRRFDWAHDRPAGASLVATLLLIA
jgi:hypothetical protein